MQLRQKDLRKRVDILRGRISKATPNDIRKKLLNHEELKEFEIDQFARYYIDYGRTLEAEDMLYNKGIPGM